MGLGLILEKGWTVALTLPIPKHQSNGKHGAAIGLKFLTGRTSVSRCPLFGEPGQKGGGVLKVCGCSPFFCFLVVVFVG